MALFARDFVGLVLVGFALAPPLGYLAMERWLEGLDYRTETRAGAFIVTGVLTVAIALGTISYQAIRAALSDPVNSLRHD